ncbi:MAG: MarR family transcriptional regulator [Clostridia bacterium]|nr:MarR family transcriptional regulator [Clostridia bacterium]
MRHILDIEKDRISILSLASWLEKIFDDEFAKLSKSKILNQRASRYILLTLSVEDCLTQNQLVRLTHLKGSTISVALEKMELEGLIEREEDMYDGRQHRVFLTNKGYEIKKSIDEAIKEIEKKAFDGLLPKDISRASEVLSSIINNLENK